jgi:hypothetical protein
VVPPPHALSKSAGTSTDNAREKVLFMNFPPIPFAAETIAASGVKNKVYWKIGKNVISEK